uniref:Uncharacterized protein n=1 Tax=Glossina palpalis gambiensis TaxID=67801 RepID=A0A1B0BRZ6_9MUSC
MERGHGRANGVPPCHTTGTTTVQPPSPSTSPSPSVLPSSVIAEAALETFSSQAGTAIRRNNSGAGSLNSVTSHAHAAFTSKTDHGQRTSLASICKISHDNEQTTAATLSKAMFSSDIVVLIGFNKFRIDIAALITPNMEQELRATCV